MRTVSFFHKDTGLLNASRLTASDDRAVLLNTPHDHIPIEGHHDHLSKRVDVATGMLIDYQPPQPSDDHEWNTTSKRWVIKADVTATAHAKAAALAQIEVLDRQSVRAMREMLLGVPGAQDRLTVIEARIEALREALRVPR